MKARRFVHRTLGIGLAGALLLSSGPRMLAQDDGVEPAGGSGAAAMPLPAESDEATTGDEYEEVVESEGAADQGEPEAANQKGVHSPNAADQSHQLFLPAIQSGNAAAEQVEVAFQHTWSLVSCVNVTNNSTNRGLWDDMPGPGINNEAGLLWFVTNDGGNEQCSYRSMVGSVFATQLRFRAAVNDNAVFQVGLYRWVGGVCQPYLAFNTSATSDDSAFRTSPLHVFPPAQICRVQIMLTDDPNIRNPNESLTSALIDYIRLYNNGVQTWQETFSG